MNGKNLIGSDVMSNNNGDELFGSMDAFDNQVLFQDVKRTKTVHWSISWADLMMTMFILFVILYYYQNGHKALLVGEGIEHVADIGPGATIDSGSGGGIDKLKERRAGSIYELYDLSKRSMKNKFNDKSVSVDIVADEAVRVVLTGDLLFDSGQAKLKYGTKKILRALSEIIRDNSYIINVVGHTDDIPHKSKNFPTNWELSVIRACNVARFLIEDMEIPEDRFIISGHSSFQPLKPNYSYKNRSKNRRVELIFTKERPYAVKNTPTDYIRDAYVE